MDKHNAEYVRIRLRAAAVMMGSQRKLAGAIGCSPTFLNDIVLGKREPAGKVLAYLGLKRKVSYVPL